MSGHYKLMEDFRQRGYRLTPQREMILLAIHESEGHVSAEELYERVKAQNPCVDISTIYRTLELLKELRFVNEVNLGHGCVRYEQAAGEPHHHLICKRCGNVLEMEHDLIAPLHSQLLERYGFQADLSHIAISGLCQTCRADSEA